jgi:hypothetical protein
MSKDDLRELLPVNTSLGKIAAIAKQGTTVEEVSEIAAVRIDFLVLAHAPESVLPVEVDLILAVEVLIKAEVHIAMLP